MMDMMAMMGGGMGANNPDATPADSFTGGVEDIESALMEGEEYIIDELQAPKKKPPMPGMGQGPGQGMGPGMGMGPMGPGNGGQNEQDQMLMEMMQKMQGGTM